MKSESSVRRWKKKLQSWKTLGVRQAAAQTAVIGVLDWMLGGEFDPESCVLDAMVDDMDAAEICVADANVESVVAQLRQRAAVGLQKYGVTTERGDLSRVEWLRHAQQEAMDLAVYLERLICDEQNATSSDSGPPA